MIHDLTPTLFHVSELTPTLFHVSEDGGINRFEPRAAKPGDERLVWAIADARLHNYLLPRDCPRVTYYAGPDTTAGDRARFLGSNRSVIAVERHWFDRLRHGRLYCYHLPPATFQCADQCAGYFVSRTPVVPSRVTVIDDPLGALLDRGAELRVVANLWPLRDDVVASTLQFSIIRMRNALPRPRDIDSRPRIVVHDLNPTGSDSSPE